jgi:hypothetical protein
LEGALRPLQASSLTKFLFYTMGVMPDAAFRSIKRFQGLWR